MSELDLRYLYALEEDEYRQALGKHLAGMLEDADERQRERRQGFPLLDTLARHAKAGGAERE